MPMLNVNVLNANVEVSDNGSSPNPQIGENDPKWVQNGRQDPRIGPNESYGCSGAFGMGLAHYFFSPAKL